MYKLAQSNGVPIGEKFASPYGTYQTAGNLVSLIVQLSFIVAGILILFLFIFAGFSMILGAGSGDAQKAAKGRQAATAAVLGFIIVFVAYWIVKLIESITGAGTFLTNPPIQ
jgi:hypothetical protein